MDFLEQFIAELNRNRQAQKDQTVPAKNNLSVVIRKWYDSLTAEEQSARFSITELSKKLGYSPTVLGPVLHDMGWTRKRNWTGRVYNRYWEGPGLN